MGLVSCESCGDGQGENGEEEMTIRDVEATRMQIRLYRAHDPLGERFGQLTRASSYQKSSSWSWASPARRAAIGGGEWPR